MSAAMLRGVLAAAWRDARRVRLWLPLYALSLVLGLVQAWPLVDNRALHNPYLSTLAFGGSDAWMAAAVSNPPGATVLGGLYAIITLGLVVLFGAAYNFVSGAMLARWAGTDRYFSGGLRYFLTFALVGMVLLILAALAIAGGAGTLAAGAGTAAAIIAWAMLQLVNVLGEYARVSAVARLRRNPFAVLGLSAAFVCRHALAVLALAAIGIAVQGALWLALAIAGGLATAWPLPLAFVIQQVIIFALLWSKVFRLALAWHLVRVAVPAVSSHAASPARATI